MRNALGVRRFAATAGDLTQSGSIEQCEASEMFGGHGSLVNQWVISLPGASRATSRRRRSRLADSPRAPRQSAPRARRVLQRQSHPFRRGSCGASRNRPAAVARVCEWVTTHSRCAVRGATPACGSRRKGSEARAGRFQSEERSRGRERHRETAAVDREARSWRVGPRRSTKQESGRDPGGRLRREICERSGVSAIQNDGKGPS